MPVASSHRIGMMIPWLPPKKDRKLHIDIRIIIAVMNKQNDLAKYSNNCIYLLQSTYIYISLLQFQ
jgi:hypothetical protein